MLEETSIRERRARIPWACGHEAATRSQTSLPYGGLILGSAAPSRGENGRAPPTMSGPPLFLIRFPPLLLAQSLPRKRFFRPALLAGFHIEAMFLDFLDDDFSHCFNSPPIRFGLVSCVASRRPATVGCVLLRAPPLVLIIACIVRFADAPRKVAGIF